MCFFVICFLVLQYAFNVIYDIVCFCFIDLVILCHDSGQPYACVVPADVFVCVLWGSHCIMWPAGVFPWYAHSLLYGRWSKFECVCMWTFLYVFILSLYACENKYCILLFLSVQILKKKVIVFTVPYGNRVYEPCNSSVSIVNVRFIINTQINIW